ncbi:MAG: hypothetical protein KDC54_16760, partial [Lewinella sp.]|nr:hypothetical protein [Lewinella sp.]
RMLRDELRALFPGQPIPRLLFPEHHLSHAASAFYPSPFEEAAILTIDGVGEWATASIGHGRGQDITILRELRFPHSLGLLYSAFTYFLGFKVNFGEYKLMGLAPYGDPDSPETEGFIDKIKTELLHFLPDGSLWLNQRYFRYATGLRMVDHRRWEALFGFSRRSAEAAMEQHHCNLALAIQRVTEEAVLHLARAARELTNARQLVLAGGVALNCVANGELLRTGLFDDIWIQPAAGDAGGAPGAALAASHLYFREARPPQASLDGMNGAYLGPEFSAMEMEQVARRYKAPFLLVADEEALCARVAQWLADGKVVGWFQGRQEFGPRALGNRSILGDARNPEMQRKLNLKIKFRESFRPFAPSVLADHAAEYFELDRPSPYMLLVAPVRPDRRRPLPADYHQRPMQDKLNVPRSDIPAVTHIDFSARVQTVHRATNPRYHRLIEAFRALTSYGLIVNTSFNVRGEPVVCTPDDAFRCFLRTDMDYLVMGNYIFDKTQQPTNAQTEAARAEAFAPD